MDTMKHAEVPESRRPPRRRPAAIAITVVIVVLAVAGAGLLITQGDDEVVSVADAIPTITFDGETASYRGSTTFDENVLTFRLENNSDSVRAAFGWNVMNDETITLEEEIASMETRRGDNSSIPPWVEAYDQIDFYVPPNAVVEESAPETLPSGKGLLYVWDARNRILYPAAHITVGTG